MTGEQVVRRLAAIVVADVVGYSRLIGADETGTLARLATLRRDIVDHAIARHAGRLFKETGDGFLVEFTSAVQAVTCAMEIQKQVEAKAGEGQPLRLRVGIHVGDVVVQRDDLVGDGVNIAAPSKASPTLAVLPCLAPSTSRFVINSTPPSTIAAR